MGGKDGRPEEVRQQVTEVLRQAQEIVGSRHRLAERLGVAPHLLDEWIAGISDAPDEVVGAAAEILMEHRSKG